ncbi:hypothetical protein N7532_009847 [Penicillium argentinense]|uniref:Uncharacterized protein n=1 Tax=Penicillium argentinense TaxID=1131581 RepID=A0A9W9ENT0_9EURO|nr:uncharacterized protein N7532_009847 [Penicillium argentinense]KAJ5085076.1 hypothetical protein N7532_009847 [Penicillium argentinense]
MVRALLAVALCLLAGVHAQSRAASVVPVEGCAALPNYNNATNIAGPWTIRVDGCTNATATQESCSIEGFGASCDVTRSADEKGIEKGSLTIVNHPLDTNIVLRCNGALNTLEARVPSGAGALDWHAIGLDKDPGTSQMEWGFGAKNTHLVRVYRQYLRGRPVDGLFLGSEGRTTWAVRSSGSGLSSLDHKPFWFLRLLNPEMPAWGDELETMIRINGI